MKDQTVQPNAPLQPKEEVQMPGLVGGDKEETTNNNRNNAMTNAPTTPPRSSIKRKKNRTARVRKIKRSHE